VVALEENYRSVQPVLDLANAVLAGATGLHAKHLRAARSSTGQWAEHSVGPASSASDALPVHKPVLVRAADEAAEAVYVCERVLEHREQGIALRDQAVLFRTGHHSARLEIELGRRHIPFVKYGGLKFLEAAHVKDLLAFLRLLENPSDELAWHRVLGLLDGIGPATTRIIVAHLDLARPGGTRRLVDAAPDVPARARAEVDLLRALLADCLDHPDAGSPAVEIELIRTHAQPLIERRYTASAARLADLEQLQHAAAGFPSRSQFLAEITIDPPARTSDLAGPPFLDDDYLVLSTIHSAKGGEWTAVYLIHAADGNLPSDMSLGSREGLEEERRLFYVAITRARDHLHVAHPLRFYDHRHALDDRHGFAQPSRFLTGTDHLFQLPPDDQLAALAAADDPLLDASSAAGPDRVADALAALWAAPLSERTS
jgi:DNA helicase-2/ATP-dependent DNA helicase PcrA